MFSKVIYKCILIIVISFAIINGCGKKDGADTSESVLPVSMKQFDTPFGADPSVSSELGGKGFTGDGWQTNEKYNIIANTNAVKGGSIVLSLPDNPITLRTYGKDDNSGFNTYVRDLLYETLIEYDPLTTEFTPLLATHWKISEDKKTFKFRINPDARWADGKPVTSEDFIATWKLLKDPDILSPYYNQLMDNYEEPKAESKYIFSIKAINDGWREFAIIATNIVLLPAHYIQNISGKDFLDKYQFSFIPGSGPYAILDKDVIKGQAITLRRRNDYWGEVLKRNTGKNNFNAINFVFLDNELLQREKLKKGEIDILLVSRASAWKTEYNFDMINRGLIVKKRVYNESPIGVNGICINSRMKPFDDVRVRKAFAYAFDRKKLNEKLFDNAYTLQYSYFPGRVYENPSNPQIGFSLDSSAALLTSAGWTNKNPDGYLIKNGKQFEVEMVYLNGQDKYLTIYQEDLKKVGIKLNLKEIDPAARTKLANENSLPLTPVNWNELAIPNPENAYRSNLADEKNNANWPGIKDKRIDELCDKYNVTSDFNERVNIIRSIDYLLCEYSGYILMWYAPYRRIVFHNKFGYPEGILDRETGIESILNLWFADPLKLKEYNEALKNESIILKTGEVDVKYWLNIKNSQ